MSICSILGIRCNGLDVDSEQDERNEKTEKYGRLQDLYLKEINKQNALHENKSLKEILNEEKMNAVIKNAIYFQPKSFNKCDAASKMHEEMMSSPDEIHVRSKGIIEDSPNTKFSSVYDTDITRMVPCTYSDAARISFAWIDGEMKNNTDYATKIFNKEDAENIFSISFCKVPVKSEEDE